MAVTKNESPELPFHNPHHIVIFLQAYADRDFRRLDLQETFNQLVDLVDKAKNAQYDLG